MIVSLLVLALPCTTTCKPCFDAQSCSLALFQRGLQIVAQVSIESKRHAERQCMRVCMRACVHAGMCFVRAFIRACVRVCVRERGGGGGGKAIIPLMRYATHLFFPLPL